MERVNGVSCTVGESPTWSAAEGAWYWVDIPARRVWRMDGSTGAARYWDNAEMVACVAAKAGGGLIAGMETGIFSLSLGEAQAATAHKLAAPASGLGEGMRFNDGRCDRQGLWPAPCSWTWRGARGGPVVSLRCARHFGAAGVGAADAERHGVLAGWPHHVPVGFASAAAHGVGVRLRYRRWRAFQSPRVCRHDGPGRPSGWRCGRCRWLLLDLR
jgi:hypothetical protein